MWRSEVELCIIKMAATYTFFFPASLWSTTEDSVTLATPHKRHTHLISQAHPGPRGQSGLGRPSSREVPALPRGLRHPHRHVFM